MKTPDEIKNGLSLHRSNLDCDNICPYDGWNVETGSCVQRLMRDTVEYIEHLESRLAQVERERDAAVKDLSVAKSCKICKNYAGVFVPNICMDCIECCNFEWRGVCAENTKEGPKCTTGN